MLTNVVHCYLIPFTCNILPGVLLAANKALDALKRMRPGMTADKKVEKRKRIKTKMSTLFRKKQKVEKRVAWCHKFVCLAFREQNRQPTTDADKEELYQAGLGVKELGFSY